jgi:hypothetical protein
MPWALQPKPRRSTPWRAQRQHEVSVDETSLAFT